MVVCKKSNRHLVDHSSLCICYYTGQKGGTEYAFDHAIKNKLKVLNITLLSI